MRLLIRMQKKKVSMLILIELQSDPKQKLMGVKTVKYERLAFTFFNFSLQHNFLLTHSILSNKFVRFISLGCSEWNRFDGGESTWGVFSLQSAIYHCDALAAGGTTTENALVATRRQLRRRRHHHHTQSLPYSYWFLFRFVLLGLRRDIEKCVRLVNQ